MNVLLVLPDTGQTYTFNHGPAAVSATLKQKGHEVSLLHFTSTNHRRIMSKIKERKPDVVGFSLVENFYSIAKRLSKSIKRQLDIPVFWGGPFPSNYPQVIEEFDYIDGVCVGEGDFSFPDVLERIENNKSFYDVKGFWYRDGGEIYRNPIYPITPELNTLPYPDYSIFSKQAIRNYPAFSFSRGCPFKCTYCHEGHDSYQQVNRFGTKRIEDEINYISKRIGKVVKNLMIADPNFGMFDRDISLSRAISDSRKRYGYPTTVFATTAKNRKKKLIAINQELDDIVMPIWMSVQSMNDETLVNIKRKNIRIEDMISVKDALSGKSALSKSELIIPLPGETLSSHKSALVNLMELGISSIICYQLMLVEGSELKTDKIKRKEHKLHTSFRVLPRSFTKMDNLDMSLEIEEIAVSTRDFSFPDYLEARQLHLIIATCYNGGAFSGFFRLLKEQEKLFPTFLDELRLSLIENHEFRLLIEKFIFDTERELFTSKQALLEYYRSDDNFQKLISGEDGANLIQKYTSLALLQHHETIISAFEKVCLRILSNERDSMSKLLELGGYYRLLFKDFLVSERVNIINTKQFSYDFGAWLSSIKLLEQYRFDSPVEVTFYTSQNQYDMLESYFERYGQSDQSLGKILTRLNVTDLLRQQKKNITV